MTTLEINVRAKDAEEAAWTPIALNDWQSLKTTILEGRHVQIYSVGTWKNLNCQCERSDQNLKEISSLHRIRFHQTRKARVVRTFTRKAFGEGTAVYVHTKCFRNWWEMKEQEINPIFIEWLNDPSQIFVKGDVDV